MLVHVSAWCNANAIYSSVNLDFFMTKLLGVVSPEFSSYQLSNLLGGGHIHSAILGPPFVKPRRADAQRSANIWNVKDSLNAFDSIHDLAIAEF